jgi:hypothetical protein
MLCIDQSGSMAASVVYTGMFGAVLASLRAVKTHVIAFDTAVTDLTEHLADPVELLFGTQLGGGTDIHRADLLPEPDHPAAGYHPGADQRPVRRRQPPRKCSNGLASWSTPGCRSLPAGAQRSGRAGLPPANAADLAELGIPAFACTPDLFPDLMAAAIQRQDIASGLPPMI